jgi:hypothetical protein
MVAYSVYAFQSRHRRQSIWKGKLSRRAEYVLHFVQKQRVLLALCLEMESRSGMRVNCANTKVCSRTLNFNFVANFICPHRVHSHDWKVVWSLPLLITITSPLNCNDTEDKENALLFHSIERTSRYALIIWSFSVFLYEIIWWVRSFYLFIHVL